MLVVWLIVIANPSKIIFMKGDSLYDLENNLRLVLKDDYFYLYDYSYIDLKFTNVVFPKVYKEGSHKFTPTTNDEIGIVQEAIDYLKNFNYSYSQSNPNEVERSGLGNCQSLSLILKDILNSFEIECSLVLEENHLVNKLSINGLDYILDLSNGKFYNV